MLKEKVLLMGSFLLTAVQENQPPEVKLVTPKSADAYHWGAPMRYSITVKDKEDGDSKFDEINPNEVLLEVNLGNPETAKAQRSGLQSMMASNCMNCHAFNSKLIGPSFTDISKKYTAADMMNLVKHVKEGSKGIWGNDIMPTHPELSDEQMQKMVKWILDYTSIKDVSYYTGTEGSFRVQKPTKPAAQMTLTAIYVDHGKAEGSNQLLLKATD